ncbi:uncharacterized protein LY89DRAFT_673192 [Mollisia scopiformis]|uniref:Uncharacterized protein n=1 Tax=Mollisia scopiformis TaxID=149040 RepID=A0A194WZG1_MOLSC|nr:uncharacterized protein LY89DRAFT_673192 [Mollisia scopiformis]KUJ13094.1 hypothetical protein LY89DRAFT_673192 [Mollisia scopiformis]
MQFPSHDVDAARRWLLAPASKQLLSNLTPSSSRLAYDWTPLESLIMGVVGLTRELFYASFADACLTILGGKQNVSIELPQDARRRICFSVGTEAFSVILRITKVAWKDVMRDWLTAALIAFAPQAINIWRSRDWNCARKVSQNRQEPQTLPGEYKTASMHCASSSCLVDQGRSSSNEQKSHFSVAVENRREKHQEPEYVTGNHDETEWDYKEAAMKQKEKRAVLDISYVKALKLDDMAQRAVLQNPANRQVVMDRVRCSVEARRQIIDFHASIHRSSTPAASIDIDNILLSFNGLLNHHSRSLAGTKIHTVKKIIEVGILSKLDTDFSYQTKKDGISTLVAMMTSILAKGGDGDYASVLEDEQLPNVLGQAILEIAQLMSTFDREQLAKEKHLLQMISSIKDFKYQGQRPWELLDEFVSLFSRT